MCILLLLDGMVYMLSITSIRSNVSFKANVYLLIFCLNDLSIGLSGELTSPTIIVLLSVSPFMSVNIYFMYLVLLFWLHIYLQFVISSWVDLLTIM